MFTSFGIHKRDIISSDWVWGNKKTMSVYCNTYNYVLEQNKKANGNYIFHFESNHTDIIVDHNIPIKYCNIYYNVDLQRKIFDKTWNKNEDGAVNDSRKVLPSNQCILLDIKSTLDTYDIPPIPGR
jgi:hypothetical protein